MLTASFDFVHRPSIALRLSTLLQCLLYRLQDIVQRARYCICIYRRSKLLYKTLQQNVHKPRNDYLARNKTTNETQIKLT